MADAQSSPPLAQVPDPAQIKTSTAAIWSLVFGILSFCLPVVGTIIALILGIVALLKISGAEGRLTGKGLAIAGIVTGSIGIFVSAILAAIIIPAVSGVQDRAASIKEVNNVKNLTIACRSYAADGDGSFPEKLQDLYPDYIDVEELLKAVDPKTKETEDYLYFSGLTDVSRTYLPLIASPFVNHKNNRVVGMVDGHVMQMREEEYQELLKTPKMRP